jgi:hypothetical protein
MSSQLERVMLSRIAAEIDGRSPGKGSGLLGFWSSWGMMRGGTRGLKVAMLLTGKSLSNVWQTNWGWDISLFI